ncbi:MAG: hypothetical protein RR540_07135 [Oscillospiraceae bacterium]
MDDLMGKLQAMLSDEESMNQIKQLAGMLGVAPQEEPSPAPLTNSNRTSNNRKAPPQEPNSAPFSQPSSENSGGDFGGFGFDMGTLFQLQGLMKSVSANDKNADLLIALKPHLREEKQAKVDKAVKLLKLFALWTVVKESGLLKSIDLF